MIKVSSRVKINNGLIRSLERNQITALEQTAEALHTEVVQAQVMPRDSGAMQNEQTFVDYSDASKGSVSIVTSTPYARKLYFHPEYDFQTTENPNAKGEWFEDWLPGGSKADFASKAYANLYRRLSSL